MVLIKIDSLSQKELEYIAEQEGIDNASDMSRDDLIECLRDLYDDEKSDAEEGGEENIQRRFVSALTDYRGGASDVTSLPGVEELPELYAETSVHVLLKNATWLYCYWSLAPLDMEKLTQELGDFELLLHVTVSEEGQIIDSYDISVSFDDCQWNINVNAPRGLAQVSLVAQNSSGRRVELAQSGQVQLVTCYWLEHRDEIRSNEDLLRLELGLLTNREGAILSCETVESIVDCIKEEGVL